MGWRWDDVGICRVFYLHTHPQLVAVALAVSCLQLGSRLGVSRMEEGGGEGGQQKPQAKHLSHRRHRMRRVGNARGRRKSDIVNHSGHTMAMTMKYEICNPRRRQQQQQQQQVEEEAWRIMRYTRSNNNNNNITTKRKAKATQHKTRTKKKRERVKRQRWKRSRNTLKCLSYEIMPRKRFKILYFTVRIIKGTQTELKIISL